MNTLKQIRDKKRKEISKNIENFSFKVALSNEQQDECFKEWLQQKQLKYEKHIAITFFVYELLEELEEKKQQ